MNDKSSGGGCGIAVLMLVHKDKNQAQRLIDHLSKDFAVFVHIDKRSRLKIRCSENVFIFKKYKSYHGSFNLTMAALFLLQAAFKIGYDRYILISAQDLPVVSNTDIINFFKNNNHEYLELKKIPTPEGWPPMDRLISYYPNNFIRNNDRPFYIFLFRCQRKLLYIYSKIRPRQIDGDFYGGSQWTNYTHACVEKIFQYLKNNKKIINRFKWTHCSDEIFFQTIIRQITGLAIIHDNLRYIDWDNGPESPRILRKEDYDKIIRSNSLFARKFDPAVDNDIIEQIYRKIE
ncbi:MAG: beta-1,6-N-acetylglucosaminyltransferase [Bacteroidales bacterium]|nr:beta-1,6-N-acetylglucosaminyltransferase [Bacteroidales bacterium]